MYNLKVFNPPQDDDFYTIMGRFFADRKIIKELDNQLYNDEDTTWILCFDDKHLKGFISVQHKKDHEFIDNFYVIEKYRKTDVGNVLLDKAIEISGGDIKLITRNEIAYSMFTARGFETYRKNGRYFYMELKK